MPQSQDFGPHTQGKIIQTDYDTSIGVNQECMVCLTQGQVNAILAIVDYFGWTTRWYSNTQDIDQTAIRDFQGDLIRRLLNMCCCNQSTGSPGTTPEDNYVRINDDGYQETSNDNGETWEVNTASDYRFNGGIFPRPDPSTLGEEPDCSYTLNLQAQIERAQQEYNAAWDVGEELTGLISAIVGIITTWGLVLTGLLPTLLITAIVVAVLAVGRAAWNAAFTSGFYSELKCSILDNMPSNGVWSPTGWENLLASVNAQELSIARIWTWNLIRAMGSNGLTNASAIPSYSEDTCEECGDGWCVDDSFDEDMYDWAPRVAGGHDYASWETIYWDAVTLTWNSPPGNDDSTIQIEKTGLGTMEAMTVWYTGSPNSIDIEFYLESVLQYTHSLSGAWSGVEFTFDPVTFDMVRPVWYNISGGGMTIERIKMRGPGSPPFDGGDCD